MNHDGILLLGGRGFIGGALAKRLRQESVCLHILGRQEIDQLAHVLPMCNTVIHLASATTPGSSANRPELELSNLKLTLKLVRLMKTQSAKHLIFFSSGGTVYGNPDILPVNEDSPMRPLSPHGAGKVAQEVFCQTLRGQGHAVTILRPSNAYGPGQVQKIGFGLVRTMLECIRAGTTLEIWGDGEQVRDFIYIDDIVEACMQLIRLKNDSSVYNLGSGVGYSVNQVKRIVETVCGVDLKIIYRPTRAGDVRTVVLDNSCLCDRLGWQVSVDLMSGVENTWKVLKY